MFNRHIALSFLSIVVTLAVMTGATLAYFTDTASSADNIFQTGTMTISIDQSNGIQTINPVISNWMPGQAVEVRFDVVNGSSIPVNLKANATGTWGVPVLDSQNKVKVTKVEYFNGTWQTITTNAAGITGDVFYSPDGSNVSLFELAAGAREEFRLTVELDSTAGDDFQAQTFTAQVNATAKQTNAPSF